MVPIGGNAVVVRNDAKVYLTSEANDPSDFIDRFHFLPNVKKFGFFNFKQLMSLTFDTLASVSFKKNKQLDDVLVKNTFFG